MIKSKFVIKYFFFLKVLLIYLLISLKSYSENIDKKNNYITLGESNAPIKMKIFSSHTCPHCANFHINELPKIKEEYVKTGIVQIIFIDFPLDQAAFNASKLLHCLDKKKQITFLDSIYENQNEWITGSSLDEINNNLKNIVKILGISSSEFDTCINNDTISDKILNGRIEGQQKYSISSTPTIIINEKKLEGSVIFKNIKKRIDKLI